MTYCGQRASFWRRATGVLAAVPLAALLLAPAAASAAPASPTASPVERAPPQVFLESLTWTELRDAIAGGATTALLPIGGTEQSGPAIALGKHNARVQLLSGRIAQALGNAIVAPVVSVVPEGNIAPPSGHMRFAGTMTVPASVFEGQIQAMVASLEAAGFRDIVLLGDHGGYQDELQRLAQRLDRSAAPQGHRVFAPAAYFRAASQGYARLLHERGYRDDEIGSHAALADTSMQLAADPAMVRQDVLRTAPHLDASMGVYGGDPRRASAELGQLGLDLIVHDSVEAIRSDIALAHGKPAPR